MLLLKYCNRLMNYAESWISKYLTYIISKFILIEIRRDGFANTITNQHNFVKLNPASEKCKVNLSASYLI